MLPVRQLNSVTAGAHLANGSRLAPGDSRSSRVAQLGIVLNIFVISLYLSVRFGVILGVGIHLLLVN